MNDQEKLKEVLTSAQDSLTGLYPALRARHFMVGTYQEVYELTLRVESALYALIAASQKEIKP